MLALREIMLIIRAKDQASRTLAMIGGETSALGEEATLAARKQMGLGTALTGVGLALTAIGAAGVATFVHAINTASDYEQQVAKTKTQVDAVGVSTQFLSKLGLEIARNYPVAFDKVQATLYDLFSSIDVSKKQAVGAIKMIAMTSVAGDADMQTSGRALISVLNAYGMKVQDIGHVSDVMFQLVRKGVGTFDEFTNVIGRASPAAIAAGQHFETLAGTLAFLTRNGLSAAMAASSSARAMELVAKPDVAAKLAAIGVSVKDQNGNFKQLNDIITELAVNKGWATMTKPELAKAFQETFGTGTIQARRFFNTAIPNWQQYNKLTGDMRNSSGQMLSAYVTMFDTPQNKSKLFQNKLHALTVEIGQILLPAFTKLVEIGTSIVKFFESLPGPVKEGVVIFGAVVSVLLLIVGPLMVIIGLIITFSAVMALADIAMLPILVTVGLVIGAIILIGIAIAALIIYWDDVSKAVSDAWDWIVKSTKAAYRWVIQAINDIIKWFKKLPAQVGKYMEDLFNTIVGFFGDLPGEVMDILGSLWDDITSLFSDGVDAVVSLVEDFVTHIPYLIGFLVGATIAVLIGLPILVVKIFVQLVVMAVQALIENGPKIIEWFINLVLDIVSFVSSLPGKLFDLAVQALTWFLNGLLSIAGKIWDFISSIPGKVISFLASLPSKMLQAAIDAMTWFWDGLQRGAKTVLHWVANLPQMMFDRLKDLANSLWDIGKAIMNGLWNGLKAGWNTVTDWLGNLNPADWFNDINLQLGHAQVNLLPTGHMVFQGLQKGMEDEWRKTAAWLNQLNPAVELSGTFGAGADMGSFASGFGGSGNTTTIMPGAVTITVAGDATDATIAKMRTVADDAIRELAVQVESRN